MYLRVHNNLLHAIYKKEMATLMPLDPDVAFDTGDHKILLDPFSNKFRITGVATFGSPTFTKGHKGLQLVMNFQTHSFYLLGSHKDQYEVHSCLPCMSTQQARSPKIKASRVCFALMIASSAYHLVTENITAVNH